MSKPIYDSIIMEARLTLGWTQRDLADKLEVARRTVGRWESGGSASLLDPQWHELARSVFPRDAELAERLAKRGNSTLLALGLVESKPPKPPEPVRVKVPAHLLVDSVLCAVMEACELSPAEVRTLLAPAFRRAADLELTVEDVARVLEEGRDRAARGAKGPARKVTALQKPARNLSSD